ncbi:MAG TPA: sigma-70 family RNA polymerase sigma factor [Planctomycetota bacterium]|nr:sigma-70 family RNA polymerase sigma factor [Planctomycetota bacterium]
MADEPLIKQLLRHQAPFMGYLVAMTRDLAAAEEIFQNVAVVVLEQGPQERIRDFHAWAKEIVRRQALHYLRERSQSRRLSMAPELMEGLSLALEEGSAEPAAVPRDREALVQCLKSLPPRSRRIMTLRYEKQRSFEEIGEALESSAQAIQKTLSRIRRSLHDCVQNRLLMAEGSPKS